MPIETVQPIVLFYNKKVFDKVGVQPPQSYGDILALVPKFNAGRHRAVLARRPVPLDQHDVAGVPARPPRPARRSSTTSSPGKKGAWSDPAVLDMLTKVQDLVKTNAFVKGFSSITADSNADQALLYTGKAAMMLHGSWSYGIQKANGGDFVKSGGLGWMNFPPIEGGKGDPSNTVGNPGQYLSISSKATADAEGRRQEVLLDHPARRRRGGRAGSSPAACRSSRAATAQLTGSPDAEFLKFVYDTSANAKTFAQSWDQALSPTAAETLLDNIAKLFQLQITPQQWVDSMNGVIGK